MSTPLEDYAFLSDRASVALVSRDGSVDWWAVPRVDSAACFARLLGDEDNGHWTLAPTSTHQRTTRRYRGDTLVLETVHDTPDGQVAVIDCLDLDHERHSLVRMVEGRSGRVPMRSTLRIRFDYGSIVPWLTRMDGSRRAIGGPDALCLRTPVDVHGEDFSTVAEFSVAKGDRVPFELTWHSSTVEPPPPLDVEKAIAATEAWWLDWIEGCTYRSSWESEVRRSLTVLKGLTSAETGGIVAAATTSLPEELGGTRNWDYRFCWLRDATFTLLSLLEAGFTDEARAWRDWLIRSVAGQPSRLQNLYGMAGERRLPELELDWLAGYEGSRPVRIGNAAADQFQLDTFGEVMDAVHQARVHGIGFEGATWNVQKVLLDFLESHWDEPDEGIWEVRGPRRHFTHSKVMAWVAMDRAVKSIEQFGLDGPVDRWRAVRRAIHEDVCEHGVDERGVFTQSYGDKALDAAVLAMPLVGFLPARDPRVRATVDAVATELDDGGFIRRYEPAPELEGLSGHEGAFLMCTFWLADNYALQGRLDEANAVFDRLLDLQNDLGLLAEEVDPATGRLLGNFPQAFSHVALVNSAAVLCTTHESAAEARAREEAWHEDDESH